MRTLLIIPAYNEEANIARVVNEIVESYPQYDYVVVNDGSTDGTTDVCRQHGFRFLDLPVNLGLAGAFQTGIKYALRKHYDCAIQFDADGQHRPEYLDALVAATADYDIVIGSRFLTESKPHSMRMLGSNLLAAFFRLCTHTTVNDPTSGMRAYNHKAIHLLATGPNLGPEPDTMAYLVRKKGLTIGEVQVHMGERMAGESYLTAGVSISYMARQVVSMLLFHHFR
ncbi:MAG: glycosyltransferase family 2 protein [Eggerthellaceae bacterium]|nr:glycosyltransferase family 2 protein [Eggerthellaceae bacterium]